MVNVERNIPNLRLPAQTAIEEAIRIRDWPTPKSPDQSPEKQRALTPEEIADIVANRDKDLEKRYGPPHFR